MNNGICWLLAILVLCAFLSGMEIKTFDKDGDVIFYFGKNQENE